ncbi:MAG: cob(I)yrinic acid a,c-diamide adenosyltransferase [Gammaproteobacteria bacterium]|nr:cob(I)yrinic acid a,c-diamide adenosyltransferase [Gammaproteobacteria bacterium]
MTKIYTKKGDLGMTVLRDKKKIPKDDPRVVALGAIDELNSVIGMVLATHRAETRFVASLNRIQHELFDVGNELSNPGNVLINEFYVNQLEQEIDQLEELLPPLKKFILPTGNIAAATCHLARAVCRRAERNIVTLSHRDKINPFLLQYMNRLSDWLFMISRIM